MATKATQPKAKSGRAKTPAPLDCSASAAPDVATAEKPRATPGASEALRFHLETFRDDLMRQGHHAGARRMTWLLREFDYLARGLDRPRV
jgi:hypothetical protein